MMSRVLSLHVTYNGKHQVFNGSLKGFLGKLETEYGLKKDEIKVYRYDKNVKGAEVSVEDLKGVMKILIERRQRIPSISKRPRLEKANEMTSTLPTSSNIPTEAELIQKIQRGAELVNSEKRFIIGLLQGHYSKQCHNTANKRVQASPSNMCLVTDDYSQTDDIIENSQDIGAVTPDRELVRQGKRQATHEKINWVEAKKLMERTFRARRFYIKKERPLVSCIKEEYPLLFTLSETRNEMDRIFESDRCNRFISRIEESCLAVLSLCDDKDPLLLSINEHVRKSKTTAEKKYAREVGSLLIISSAVKENRHFLHLDDRPQNKDDFPRIEVSTTQSGLYRDRKYEFRIMVEDILLCVANDFKEAMLCLIASYFIFNIQYPPHNHSTLVLIEKVYLEATDTMDIEEDILGIIGLIKTKRMQPLYA